MKERYKAFGKYLRNKSGENYISYKHLRNFLLSSISCKQTAYTKEQKKYQNSNKLSYELKIMKINFANKPFISDYINDTEIVNDHFMSVYDSSNFNHDITE